jgi:hypothetical protein
MALPPGCNPLVGYLASWYLTLASDPGETRCPGRPGGSPAVRSNPAGRDDLLAGLFTLGDRPHWRAAQPGGCDEQISWATAEPAAPDLAWNIPVGYTVNAWIHGKEKVYGSIP